MRCMQVPKSRMVGRYNIFFAQIFILPCLASRMQTNHVKKVLDEEETAVCIALAVLALNVMWLFLTVPWVGLQFVIVVFHTKY